MRPYGKEFGFWVCVERTDESKDWCEIPLVWVPDELVANTMLVLEWQPRASEPLAPEEQARLKAAKEFVSQMHQAEVDRWFTMNKVKKGRHMKPEDLINLKAARGHAVSVVNRHIENQIEQVLMYDPTEEELEGLRARAEQAMSLLQPKKGYSEDFDYKYKYKYAYKYIYTD